LLKTFWGWQDQQLPDGTIIWTLPNGHTYVTTPGSALLFPGLCAPTGDLPQSTFPPEGSTDRATLMPRRASTRAQDRAHHIASERRQNREARAAREHRWAAMLAASPPDDEPPPF
jgi:hypothetical protein